MLNYSWTNVAFPGKVKYNQNSAALGRKSCICADNMAVSAAGSFDGGEGETLCRASGYILGVYQEA